MKLVWVSHYFPLEDSGALRAYDFARFLVAMGNEVTVVSRMNLHDIFRVKASADIGGVEVYRAVSFDLLLSEAVLDVFQIFSTLLLCFVVAVLKKADFIVISVPPGVPGIGAFFAGRLLHKKLVVDVRDKWEDHSIYFSKYRLVRLTHRILKRLYDVLYRKADSVVTVTPSLVRYLKARGVIKVILIPNGADVNLFRPREDTEKLAIRSELGLAKEDTVLVYAGGIGYYRPDVVIQALHNLIKGTDKLKLKFVVMGRGEPYRVNEMLELIKNLELQNDVIFLGQQKREIVARILPCCDVGIVPYDDKALWVYAYPLKFFDYCASGLPVIATALEDSELASLMRKHNVGYIAEPLKSIEVASAIRRFCNLSEKEKRSMSKRARSLAVNTFNRAKTAERLMEMLQGISE